MRIQHNIMAMNSYRNYSSNTKALSKNLEKLSSGYKINRAGDDAAGLAISEKMRAQITGLEAAQKNAKDGISLVQTAEGALTEVHSMLNRMLDLADQSANGTYDNEVDRANLQKEVSQLKEEIDRIADATNFNGIKLLDGSLGSSGAGKVSVDVKFDALNTKPGVLDLQAATSTNSAFKLDSTKLTAGTKYDIELKFADANGTLQSKTVSFTAAGNTAGDNDAVISAALKEAFGDDFTVTVGAANDTFTVTGNKAGADNKMEVFSVGVKNNTTGAAVASTISGLGNNPGTDAYYDLDTTALGTFTGAAGQNYEDFVFEINGQKFALTDAAGATALGKTDPSIHTATSAADLSTLINDKTGIASTNNAGTISLKAGNKAGATGNGLKLQIGDTADSYNQLTVNVGDMHTGSLGISGVDIASQSGAQSAIKSIKDAINTVSSTRGTLGALQNRLDHTINNLSVMTENIQDAEANIRDVDVAKEMMSYTKNNILVQSAQAMLAQANQVPQGVLQLLQ